MVSDADKTFDVYYTMEGPGVTEFPFNIFSLNRENGLLTVHETVDREVYPKFKVGLTTIFLLFGLNSSKNVYSLS